MAVQDMKVIALPGRSRIKIPIVGTKKNNELSGVSKATKEWTLRMDLIFVNPANALSHALETLESGEEPPKTGEFEVELFGFTYETTRETVGHSVNQLIASASIRHSDVILVIQNSTYSPKLEQYMNDGTLIDNVEIYRHGFVDGSMQLLEARLFKDCYITHFQQVLDYVVLHVRVLYRHEISYIYSQRPMSSVVDDNGQVISVARGGQQGMSVSVVDFRSGHFV
jgi:type VI protein secretion system component Hcp